MAEAAIQAALEQGGAIRAAILQEIANAFQPGQAGNLAVKAAVKDETIDAVAAALKDPASDLSTLVKDEYDRRADAEFPYRAKLRGLSIADWVAAWRDLVVDQDQVSWTLQAVETNSSLATILALQAANPTNPELQELRRASTARYAAKLSWKALCLPSHGGSWEKLKNFLLEKADSPLDNVKALARSLLVLVNLLDRRCTVVQSAKKTGPAKAAAQKAELMELIHLAIKQYKRRTTKASASVSLEHEVLLRDFAQDLLLADAALTAQAAAGKRAAASYSDLGGSAQKAPRTGDEPGGSASQASGRGGGGSGQASAANKKEGPVKKEAPDRKQLLASLLQELESVAKAGNTKKVQAWVDKQYLLSDVHKSVMTAIFREHVCKNCLFGGKGVVKHSLKQCREMGNVCVLPCTKCTAAGRKTSLLHWIADCKH